MDINDRIKISSLFQLYGELLTEKQRETLRLYCDLDLTLFEIADRFGVSRQAIRDSIKHAVDSLYLYEDKVRMYEFRQTISSLLSSDLDDKAKVEEIRKLTE